MRRLEAVVAIAVKDWTRFVRQPFLMVIGVAIPLVFILFYSLIVPVSNNNPIMVADLDGGPGSARLIEAMRTIRSDEGPYYDVLTTDPDVALRAFDGGGALAVVVIPEGFSAAAADGGAQVELRLNNINSDYSKNLRLRLDAAVRSLDDELTGPVVTVRETRRFPRDPTMLGYISTSLLLFGCLYAAMVGAGLQVASEWNDRTVKNLLLAPLGRGALVAGKAVAGLGQSLASVALVLLVLGSKQIAILPLTDVPTAMITGSILALIATRTNPQEVTKKFFDGMGSAYGNVMGLIVAAGVFTAGMAAMGLTDALIETMKGSESIAKFAGAFGPFLIAVISGSGDAAALAFNGAITPQAEAFGMSIVDLGSLAQMAGAIGRSMSPVAGAAMVCAGLAKVSPMEISKRNAIPMLLATITFMIALFI